MTSWPTLRPASAPPRVGYSRGEGMTRASNASTSYDPSRGRTLYRRHLINEYGDATHRHHPHDLRVAPKTV